MNSIKPEIYYFRCNLPIVLLDLVIMKTIKVRNMQFEGLSAEIKTAVMKLLFRLSRALLISSFNIAIAFVILFLERRGDA